MIGRTIRRYADFDKQAFDHLKALLDFPEIMVKLLCMRGITGMEAVKRYFSSGVADMYSPFLMKGMEKAAGRIRRAIEDNEKIVIYGDYDVDGITSTSSLYLFLRELGADAAYYIPDRIDEGYGLNSEALSLLSAQGASVVVSVDTGITAVEQAEHANTLGLDLIITDHHECQETIPDAYAVLNPKQPGCGYPYDMLSGAGVTFKLMQALASLLGAEDKVGKYLEIIAIGTIADIVPMKDENRIIAKTAFATMMNSWNKGLRALIEVSDIKNGKMSAGMIGFRIGPRLNAAGRLGDAKRAVELFISDDEETTATIAALLDEENGRRQDMEKRIFEEAVQIVEKDPVYIEEKILVVSSTSWHHGVIGIVASRLVERYYKPVILLTIEDGIASGSARSVEDFNLFEALSAVKEYFMKFGGHEMAAGMSLEADKVQVLRRAINDYADKHMDADTLVPKVKVDMKVKMGELSVGLVETLAAMEPYGVGNPEPVFELTGYPGAVSTVGKNGSHLKFTLTAERERIDCIAFGMGALADEVKEDSPISVVGNVGINEWRERKNLQVVVRDIQQGAIAGDDLEEIVKQAVCFGRSGVLPESYGVTLPARSHYEALYRTLYSYSIKMENSVSYIRLAKDLGVEDGIGLMPYLLCVPVFEELKLFRTDFGKKELAFNVRERKKVDLESSRLYNILAEAKTSQ